MPELFTPRKIQLPMIAHLHEHKRCALWAGMGTGKTTAVLSWLDAMYLSELTQPTLVLGPLRVARSVWSDEAPRWLQFQGLDVSVVIGNEKERLAALRRDAPIYTTNYENLVWLINYWGDKWPYRTVVADEADHMKGHRISFRTARKADGTPGKTYLAGGGTKRAKELAKIAHTHITRFVELTGTPAPNGLKDLWAQAWFLDRGRRLGRTYDDFSKRWFCKGYDGYSVEPKECADKQIHEALADICLAVNTADWYDLDKPFINNVYVELPSKVRAVYRELEKKLVIELSKGTVSAANAAVLSSRLIQIASGAAYTDPDALDDRSPTAKHFIELHDEKLLALSSIINETGGVPLMVCYEFKSDLARLLKAFPQGRALKTKQDEDDFKAGKLPLLFLHPKSGGHGIDGFQHFCWNIVFFSQSWALGAYQQVIERIGPMRQLQSGYSRTVGIHHILTRNTVDEDVMERREGKRDVQDILLSACSRRAKQ